MLQFPLRRLLVSFTLIAIGVGMLAILFSPWVLRLHDERPGLYLWFGAGAFVGAGVLSLWLGGYGIVLGGVVGLAAQFAILIVLHQC